MNSSMMRCAILCSAGTIRITFPSLSNSISASGRSKSTEPRRYLFFDKIRHSSSIISKRGTRSAYRLLSAGSLSARIFATDVYVILSRLRSTPFVKRFSITLPLGSTSIRADKHQSVITRIQTADPAGKTGRKHGDGAVGKVHRRSPRVGIGIERRAFTDVVRYIRNMHRQ